MAFLFSNLDGPNGLHRPPPAHGSSGVDLAEDGDTTSSSPPPPYSPADPAKSPNMLSVKETVLVYDDRHPLEEAILDTDGELPRLVKEMKRRARKLVMIICTLGLVLLLIALCVLAYTIDSLRGETEIPRKWASMVTTILCLVSGIANNALGIMTSQWKFDVEAPVRPASWTLGCCLVIISGLASSFAACFVDVFSIDLVPASGAHPYWVLYTVLTFATPAVFTLSACQMYGKHTLKHAEEEFGSARQRLLSKAAM